MRDDFFDCLPRPTALLLLCSLLDLTRAHVLHHLPRQTPAPILTTVPHHVLSVVSWPLRPTPPPADPFALRRRQENTICGYINGNSALAATCGAGSHCVLDTQHSVVGCCPNGAPSCTAGVFTGCVDANSGPQTEMNPYIFSCTGAAVCYKNIFDGGFSQFGCGTASDLAATVLDSASGVTEALDRQTLSLSLTQSISTLSEPTTLGSISSHSTTSSTSTSTSASSTASSPTGVANADATTSSASGASPATDTTYRTGAIVGGTIGGLAVLIALLGLAFFLLRRRRANVRQGPGPGGVRGKTIGPPTPRGGTGFAAISQDSDAYETGPVTTVFNQPPPPSTQQLLAPPAAAATRSMLPPLATTTTTGAQQQQPPLPPMPPMPFMSEVSPVADDDALTAPTDRSPYSAAAGGTSTLAPAISSASASSYYPPSSSGGATDPSNQYQHQHAPYHYPGQYPAAYAGGSGLLMAGGLAGMGGMMVNRGSERQVQRLEADQVPLTRGSAVGEMEEMLPPGMLGRIGEEEEDEMLMGEEGGVYRDEFQYQGGGGMAAGPLDQGGGGGGMGMGGGMGGAGTHDSAGSAGSEGKPLWQRNRRQSRNLMWM